VKIKPVIRRVEADRDVAHAIDHYLGEASEEVALGFVDALERSFLHIGRHPASGSTRYAHVLELPGLRCWPVKGYPHLVFYVDRDDRVDVWRILHGQRDIPAWLREDDRD
jgi:toxin ParE1/3/4